MPHSRARLAARRLRARRVRLRGARMRVARSTRKEALSPKFGFQDTPENVSRLRAGQARSRQPSSGRLDRLRNRQRSIRRIIAQGGPASRVSTSSRRTIR